MKQSILNFILPKLKVQESFIDHLFSVICLTVFDTRLPYGKRKLNCKKESSSFKLVNCENTYVLKLFLHKEYQYLQQNFYVKK